MIFMFSCYLLQKQDVNKKEIVVLGPKRSNAINIGMTVLPPPRTIKTGILKMGHVNHQQGRAGCKYYLTHHGKPTQDINMFFRHLYCARVAAKIIVLFVIVPDLTFDFHIDLITVDF